MRTNNFGPGQEYGPQFWPAVVRAGPQWTSPGPAMVRPGTARGQLPRRPMSLHFVTL